jgi:nitrogen fixation protein NifB
VLRALADCRAVLVARVGHCPRAELAAAGIEPVEAWAHQPVEAAVLGWFAARAGSADGSRSARPPEAAVA